MVFNSFNFVVFIIPVFLLYWLVFKKSAVYQNILLLGASLFFYAFADWRFLILLVTCILINFLLGLRINSESNERKQQVYLYLGVIFNVGLLLYYKYFNFFLEGFYDMLNAFGVTSSHTALSILLPLGISFFTFQNLGYLLDVYNEEIEPNSNVLEFSLFVAFFPKILSGPIERASQFIPQIKTKRDFSYDTTVDGLRQILWGLFAKVVIAENCAALANPIFNSYQEQSSSALVFGAFFYAIQLYADFSGYSNMAIGVSKLFGIQLMRNFATPFFSTNIADFWRKWHISLTTWMMDYVFTPLSFTLRRQQKLGLIVAIVTTFVLVGLWHGANWTFIVYGLFHGLYFIPLVYSGSMNTSNAIAQGTWFPSIKESVKMVMLFILVMFTDILFRADNLTMAFDYLQRVFSWSLFSLPWEFLGSTTLFTSLFILFFFGVEWINREKKHDFEVRNYPLLIRWGFYIFLFVLILFFGKTAETFIYFQF